MNVYLLYRKAINKYIHLLYNPVNKICFRLNGVQCGKGLKTRGKVYVMRHYESARITIGNGVRINSAKWANPIGCGNKTYLQVNENANLVIGNNCGISNSAFTCEKEIVIEDNVTIGAGCHIYDTDFHPLKYDERVKKQYKDSPVKRSGIRICEGAFIGAGCFILKGVTIGKHCIVGAGSVVTRDIPDSEIWGGNPARMIRKINY